MISVFSGNLGAGKTLAMSIMTYINYLQGALIYANYMITGYPVETITNTYTLKTMTKAWKVFALDEWWLTLEARTSGKNIDLSRKILQFRKRSIDCYATAQTIASLDTRMRMVTDLNIFPETIFVDDKPVLVTCYYTQNKHLDFNNWGLIKKLPSITLPVIVEGFNVADNYDTDEIVEPMETEETDNIKQFVETFKGFDGSKTDLKSLLNIEHGFNPGKAGAIADYVFFKNQL